MAEGFVEVFRALSAKWGAIPFCRLTWSVLRGTVVMPGACYPRPGKGVCTVAGAHGLATELIMKGNIHARHGTESLVGGA
ncbi:MAG: hypothetical protein HQL63_12400 [Magnetococcales bacterium]|nr:hypothetical protein [Magnetococcales bacterium]